MKAALLMILALAGLTSAQSITSDPIGFNKVTCLNNSDTIVGVPFRAQGSLNSKLASAPVINGDAATLTLANTTLTAGALIKNYVKFTSGAKDGRFYDITANTADSLTIDLNGDTLTGVTTGDTLLIAEFWTLDTLFPPAGATTSWTETPVGSGNWVPNGHAVVASSTASQTTRKTEILLPNTVGIGTNRLSQDLFYLTGGIWRKSGTSGNFGTLILQPDSCFTIRHRPLVDHATTFRSMGEVDTQKFIIPLATNIYVAGSEKRDTYIAIPRPLDVRLDQTNLIESGAFIASATASQTQRRDELLVYNNTTQLINKIPTSIYYYTGGTWRKSGDSNPQNSAVIPAGAGFTIRKYPTSTGATVFWPNNPNY